MEKKTYQVAGLSCTDCAARIEASVARLEGVQECRVDAATGALTLWLDTPDFDLEPVAAAVRATDHELLTGRRQDPGGSGLLSFLRFLTRRWTTAVTLLAALFTLLGLLLTLFDLPPIVTTTLFALAILVGGVPVARHAFQEVAIAHHLGINTLMVIAVVGAALIGEWSEAAIVVVLFALGEALEGYAAERARAALESLLDLVPPVALRLLPGGEVEEVPVEALAVGDAVLVRPGDRVSVDGVVLAGQSAVDQAPITGESVPVEKGPGDELFAGTVNTSGALTVGVQRLAEETTLGRMVALVREAQARQAPVQRFVDRFARVYTPLVTVAAALVAALPPLLLGAPFWGEGGWLMRALQLLVIACPCALVISTPVSVVSALTNAASQGVLVKGGRYLEALSRVSVFAFDKTGTLTEGRPVATDILEICGVGDADHGLQYAASVEAHSSHPLARAVVTEAKARNVSPLPVENVQILGGRGITGDVDGSTVVVASHAYCDTAVPHEEAICRTARSLDAEGKTVMLVVRDGEICSLVAVADTPRPDSRRALEALRRLGQVRTLMLTGDSPAVAHAVAQAVGIDEVRAGLLPEEKLAAVEKLVREGEVVAMVGDGVNDAPALARADVGIAMGAAGTAQAMETADVVLMGDDLSRLPFAVRLSRRTGRVVRANIIFALLIKALVFGLALAGLATLWMAIVADVGASFIVILNGLRLRRSRAS
ncbi:MAG: heavy metal translocating P-type ATPase [Anaerolineales bacterium]